MSKAGLGVDDRAVLIWAWRKARPAVLVGVGLAAIYLLLAALQPAHTHDGWDWIARNPAYRSPWGGTCCSNDCEPAAAENFREDRDGIAYQGQKLFHRNPGIYLTADPQDTSRWWRCKLNGQLLCIFKPSGGS